MKRTFIFTLIGILFQTFSQGQIISFVPTTVLKQENILLPNLISVGFDKTTHILFPYAISYVDLGSSEIIADKAADVQNLLRIKANVKNFKETNISVVTSDGRFYSFVLNYAENPTVLSYDLTKTNTFEQSAFKLKNADGTESKILFEGVRMNEQEISYYAMKIAEKKKSIKHIGKTENDISFNLQGLYVRDNVLFFHTLIANESQINYDIDFIRFFIKDKIIAKRTAMQELEVKPIKVLNGDINVVVGGESVNKIFCLQKFTIPDDKVLEVEMYERGGGRHIIFTVNNDAINHSLDLEKK